MAQLMGTRPGEDLDVGHTMGIVFTWGLWQWPGDVMMKQQIPSDLLQNRKKLHFGQERNHRPQKIDKGKRLVE